jgi:bacteriorhodopsin
MATFLSLGIITFALSSIYFLIQRKTYELPFLVSFITLISYIVMFEGSLAVHALNGEALHWTRWAFYGFSCVILAYTMAAQLNLTDNRTKHALVYTFLTMLTGAFASAYSGLFMWMMFIVGSVAYILLLQILFDAMQDKTGWLKKYLIFGWTVFPIVFLFSPEGVGMISNTVALIGYLVLDIFTKIMFYVEGFNREVFGAKEAITE